VAKSHFIAAAIGGVLVGGVFVILGVAGNQRTETIVEEAPVAAPASAASSGGLTPNAIYQHAAPAVVFVRARLVERSRTPFGLSQGQSNTATGSGFLVDHHGDILTNYHLVDGADRSSGVTVEFEDGVLRFAGVAAVDPANDLAVLRVDTRGLPPVRPLTLGDSSSVRVGDSTLAIGDPFGADRTLTSGIVSALQHQITAADGQTIDNVIQTDQPLNPGNSGGPLMDAGGQVVGVNSQVATAGPTQTLTFAIPIDTADTILSRVDHRALHVAYIGLAAPHAGDTSSQPDDPDPGAVVGPVAARGPAALAGLRAGDVIQRVDDLVVGSIPDVLALVSTRSPGQNLTLQVRRGRSRRTLTVVLGSRTVPSPGG
jgi:S1-C subfamily serine protease